MAKKKSVSIKYGNNQTESGHRTSLPNVLEEYGMQGEPKKAETKSKLKEIPEEKHQHTKRQPAENRPTTGYETAADRKAKHEKQLQSFKDFQKAKTYYYNRYMTNLKEKVEIQREKIKKKTEELQEKIREKEEQEEHDRHHVKKRLQRIDVQHDDAFLTNIPKSDYYKIVKLEKSLKAKGKLNNQTESDRFWSNIKKPEVFRSYFGTYPKGDFDTDHHHSGSEYSHSVARSSITSRHSQPHDDNAGASRRLMSRITETRETARPTTQHAPQTEKPEAAEAGALLANVNTENMTLTELGRKAAYELDKRCPQVELPELACFTLELGEKPPDPEEEMRKTSFKAREIHRKNVVKTVQKMYKLAMTHNASAVRILDRHVDDLALIMDNRSIQDITGSNCFAPAIIQSDQRQLRPLSVPQSHQLVPIHEDSPSGTVPSSRSSSTSNTRSASTKKSASRRSKLSRAATEPDVQYRIAEPLTINNLEESKKVVESKTMSTLWNNYMKAGKSVFAPS